MTGGGNGIVLIQQNRGSGAYGPHTTTGNQIHDNISRRSRRRPAPSAASPTTTRPACSTGETPGATINTSCLTGAGRFEWGGAETFAQFKAATNETGSISQSYPDTSGWLTNSPAATAGSPAATITARLANDTGSSSIDGLPTIRANPDWHRRCQRHRPLHSRRRRDRRTATADATGIWTFTPPASANGAHTVVASETDSAAIPASTSLTFTLDTTAPAVTERLANDTGSSSTDRITSNPTLTGTGDVNAVVDFTVDGTSSSPRPPPTRRAPGPSRRAASPTGRTPSSPAKPTPPAMPARPRSPSPSTLLRPPSPRAWPTTPDHKIQTDRITSDPTLTGGGAANAVVHFTVDGSAIAGTATADASGTWSFTPPSSTGRTPSWPARPTPPATRAARRSPSRSTTPRLPSPRAWPTTPDHHRPTGSRRIPP